MFQLFFQSITKQYMSLLLLIVLGINLLAFLLMGIDKYLARKYKRKHRHRIPEAVLIAFAVLGGCFGILLGMVVFHHKTNAERHKLFVSGVPVILITELILILLVLSST